ncbi:MULTISPECIES: RHS repeat-associated core domain-containing protein [Lysinibacillus]|uniref:RHS repeat-associated core domain-containing protein n=1 Tax=Lysinibacillus pinottii TaxID=2973932 RepID=A0ABT2DSA5_9BACI|nr:MULTISPECIES: RHS repeat-associated core domain-containing protein [Lysinibacillus]MCS1396959.1 RHS repeat-associated core domain-containing protein [Lysinibacillus sp. PB211]
MVAEYTYDAWGNILPQKGLDNIAEVNLSEENPYRYAGYRYDDETKLYYLMARYYNPDMGVWVWGVFMSIDPVRGDTMNPITMNGYNYANDNPVINVDSDGEFARFIPVAIGVYRVVKILFDLYKYLKNMRYLSKYVNVTKSGSRFVSITTNLTRKQFKKET